MLARFVASNAYLPTTSIVECVRYFLSACVESADAPLRGLFNEDLKWRISPPRRRPNSTNDEQAYQDGKAPLPSIRGEAIWCGRDARTEIPLGDVVASVRGRKSYVDARMRKNQRGPAHDDCVAYDTAPRGVVDKDHCRVRRVSPPPPVRRRVHSDHAPASVPLTKRTHAICANPPLTSSAGPADAGVNVANDAATVADGLAAAFANSDALLGST